MFGIMAMRIRLEAVVFKNSFLLLCLKMVVILGQTFSPQIAQL
jgi:hypothetical protein